MKKTQNAHGGTRKGASRKKELALALCVSLWMAGGGVAGAQETTVASNYTGDVYGNHTGDDLSDYSGDPNNNQVTVNEGVTVTGSVYGGKTSSSAASTATGNTVIINGTARDVYGGQTMNGKAATGNTVIIRGSAGAVCGGRVMNAGNGNATGNTVTLENATITFALGGYRINSTADIVTDNTLNLSGANTARAVKNFATINITGATWGTFALTLTGDGILQNQDNTYAAINTQDLSFSGDVPVTGTTTLISSTNALPNTLKVFTGATAKATITTAGVVVKQDATPTESKANGVTLAYKNTHTVALAADSKSITYNIANPVSTVALGSIDWVKDGTARTLTAGDFTFDGNTAIDKTDFAFKNPLSVGAGESMTLLANATGLTAKDSIAHTQTITKDETNGVKLTATLSGNITRTADTLGYTATGTTLNINLANWNGTASTVPTGWTAGTGLTVATDGMTAPTNLNPGDTATILTGGADFFAGATITGEYKWTAAGALDTTPVNGVSLTGTTTGGGVKADDTNKSTLIYQQPKNTVTGVSFGEMTWGTARDASAAIYNYENANVDLSKFTFKNPETISEGTTTLLEANATLAEMAATENNVSYSYAPVAGVTMDGKILGSYASSGGNLTYTATANQATKLTFGDVAWKDSGALMTRPANITFAGADVDTTNINFTNIKSLEANKKMTLVSDFGNSVGTITGTKYKVGSTLEGTGKASLVGSDLIFSAETGTGGKPDVTPQEQTHNTVMGATVSIAALSAGNDFVGTATEGLAMTSNVGADGVSSYANMGGGSMRQETGSHVDVHSWNAILALGHQNKKERGTFEYGAFFEYGRGNYTTYNGDERGDGSTHYTGGGLLAKWTAKHGLYVEGSLRAGTVHDDARNVLRDVKTRVPYSYETNAPYMGFHLGVGKEIALTNGNTVDVYGKYFYNRKNSVSFDVGAGDHYDLDAVTSQVVRVGARYNIKRDKWNFYAGAAYEHELDGKAAGTASNGGVSAPIRGADISGASFRGEVGATMKPGENSPWSLDLNVSGFAGKKQGFTGGVSVSFTF